jgi:CTP:molybdopterin cytidylyltransferase MocA
MIAGIIYSPSGQAFDGVRDIVAALRSARVQDVAIVARDGKAYAWFDGPVIPGEGFAAIPAAVQSLPQEDLHGVLCCLADGPTVSQALIVQLLQGFWQSGKGIVLPAEGWQPMIIGTSLVPELARVRSLEELFAPRQPHRTGTTAHVLGGNNT